jgi:hypothetical protein
MRFGETHAHTLRWTGRYRKYFEGSAAHARDLLRSTPKAEARHICLFPRDTIYAKSNCIDKFKDFSALAINVAIGG